MPRSEPTGCVLTYAERLVPLRSLRAHLRETMAEDPGFRPGRLYASTRFVTGEGEFGAHAMVTGERHGQPIAHIVAAVFAEDFSTRLAARITDLDRLSEYRELVAELARGDRLGLGIRRRRHAYRPPPGWHLVPQPDLDAAFFSPGYPEPRSCIIVSPAEPITLSPRSPKEWLDELDRRRGLPAGRETVLPPPPTRHDNLVGEEWRSERDVGVGKMVRYLVVLRDDHYFYPLRLETLEHPGIVEEHLVLLETAGTVESLRAPAVTAMAEVPIEAFTMWED
jgi:hypothetical protein